MMEMIGRELKVITKRTSNTRQLTVHYPDTKGQLIFAMLLINICFKSLTGVVSELLRNDKTSITLVLREEQERVQKKTFTNWINSYLSKRPFDKSLFTAERLLIYYKLLKAFEKHSNLQF
uniref:Uncharacterized protein n=1 Tax=Glossina austeni TaxID=7395 RepID=A0A1A9UW28_GLOAU